MLPLKILLTLKIFNNWLIWSAEGNLTNLGTAKFKSISVLLVISSVPSINLTFQFEGILKPNLICGLAVL